jgi:hypothetical protein
MLQVLNLSLKMVAMSKLLRKSVQQLLMPQKQRKLRKLSSIVVDIYIMAVSKHSQMPLEKADLSSKEKNNGRRKES